MTKIKTNDNGRVNVITVVVSSSGATFYTQEGQAINMAATDNRCQKLIAEVQSALNNGSKVVSVDFYSYEVFNQISENSGGLIKFFRVAKRSIGKLLGSRAERGKVDPGGFVKRVSDSTTPQPGTADLEEGTTERLAKAAQSAKDRSVPFDDTTVVAVVGDTPIVGAEALAGHAQAAVSQSNTKGFERFMQRLASVAKERKHTAQELLRFMEKNDLPIADDGCIVAYKSVSYSSDGVYVDNHTKSLRQKALTIVSMDAEQVDDNRRVLCSNGLHIARHGYLGGYGTGENNRVFLAKIAPENVISVPMSEQDKMRVSAYFLIYKLDNEARQALSSRRRIDEDSPHIGRVLAKVISGQHPAPKFSTHHRSHQLQPIIDLEPWKKFYDFDVPKTADAVSVASTIEETTDGNRNPKAKLNPKRINESQKKVEATVVKEPKPKKAKAIKKKAAKPKAKPKSKTDGPTQVQKDALAKLKAGVETKTQIANDAGTSTRSLQRWVDKWGLPD